MPWYTDDLVADPNCEPDSVSYTDDLVADPNYEPDSVSYTDRVPTQIQK